MVVGKGSCALATSLTNETVAAENFDPEYIAVNPNGTIPSLAAPNLKVPLADSVEILDFLDEARPSAPKLKPNDLPTQKKAQDIINLVHSDRLSTNLILLQAQNAEEMRTKQNSMWNEFVVNRQHQLQHWHSQLPDHPFYGKKLEQNSPLYELYTSEAGPAPNYKVFYEKTRDMYRDFAIAISELDSWLVLPYATGDTVTTADLHVVPWLSHAMWGAGCTDIQDFTPLENLIRKSAPGFEIGPRIKEWWSNIAQRKSFQEVFPELH